MIFSQTEWTLWTKGVHWTSSHLSEWQPFYAFGQLTFGLEHPFCPIVNINLLYFIPFCYRVPAAIIQVGSRELGNKQRN